MKEDTKKIEFCVVGMHCAACEITLESKLKNLDGVQAVDARLGSKTLVINYSGDDSEDKLAEQMTSLVLNDGYKILTQKDDTVTITPWLDYIYGFLIALGIISIYLLIERLGLLSFGSGFELNYLTAFFIGVIASLSTCAAVVGGLVLSISTNASKSGKPFIPLLLFHISRLVTFMVLGFGLGVLGKSLIESPNFNLINLTLFLKLVLFVVLLGLAINLLGIFPKLSRFQFTIPKSISKRFLNFDRLPSSVMPIFAGFATFFLPCGFTQSVQYASLVRADPVQSSILLLSFALGTLPILLLISFASTKIAKSIQSGIFYKMAGFLIFALAISEGVIAFRIIAQM